MVDLDERDRRAVGEAIARARERAEHRLRALQDAFDDIVEASAESVRDDEHDPEGHTVGFERAQVAALRDAASTELERLAAAQARLDAGTAGRCAGCGQRVPLERLLARPATDRCVRCAEGQ